LLRGAIQDRTEAKILQDLGQTLRIKQESLDGMLLEIARGAQIVTSNNDVQAFYADGEDESAFERANHVVRGFQQAMCDTLLDKLVGDLETLVDDTWTIV
jgi:hypothetical protein